MKIYFTILFCFIQILILQAQQDMQYSMYMLNKYAFNSAYAGMDESLSLTGVYRKQWAGLTGAPASQNVSIHMPFYYLNGGIGANLDRDVVGAHRNTKVTLSYNYYLDLNKNNRLAIGLAGGVIQQVWDGSVLRAPDGEYDLDVQGPSIFTHNDDYLPVSNENAIAPTFGVGVYFKGESLEAGISANNLLENTWDYRLIDTDVKIQSKRHFYGYAQYRIDIGNYFSVMPSVLVKSDINQLQTDFSTIITYNDNIFGGATFRGYDSNSIDAVVIIVGMNINSKLRLGYSHDLTLSPLSTVNTGSHEIMLNYNLNKKIGAGIPPKIIYNPRFL